MDHRPNDAGSGRSKMVQVDDFLNDFFRLREDVVEAGGDVGVKRVCAVWSRRWFVTPLFVAPEPEFGVFSNDGFHGVPASLRDLLVGGSFRHCKWGPVNDPEKTIWFREDLAGNKAGVPTLVENACHGTHCCPEAKAANGYSTQTGIDAKIGGGSDYAARPSAFDQANEGTRWRDDGVAPLGAKLVKDGAE